MQPLRKLGVLSGYHLNARDGEIGQLRQVYFDDLYWAVRYLVVHTGSWLLGRDVLILPSVVTSVDEENQRLEVNLTREQIESGPPVDTVLPVSRHYEQEYHRHYDWEPYWRDDPTYGPAPYIRPSAPEVEPKEPTYPHLRSSDAVNGYHIHALDGGIGHVEDFIVQDPGWAIRYLEIDTRNWLPGKKVLVSPIWIHQIDWVNNAVTVNLTREAIQSAPPYDASKPISQDYEKTLYKHYGMRSDEE